MSWARYDDEFPMNRKVALLLGHGKDGAAAIGLHVLANTWSRHNGTAGVLPPTQPGLLLGDQRLGRSLAGLLVQVGMFHVTADGWEIHDFAEYHDPNDPDPDRSASDRKREISEKRRLAGRAGGLAKAGKATGLPVANEQQTSTPVPDPVPISLTSDTSSRHLTLLPRRDDFVATVNLIVEARCKGRRMDDPWAYKATVARDVEQRAGDTIRALLSDGDSPEVVADWVLNSGNPVANSEQKPIVWCSSSCVSCHGDAWVPDDEGRMAPCPERTAAA